MDYEMHSKLYDLIYDKIEEYTVDDFYITNKDIKNIAEIIIETLEKNKLLK